MLEVGCLLAPALPIPSVSHFQPRASSFQDRWVSAGHEPLFADTLAFKLKSISRPRF